MRSNDRGTESRLGMGHRGLDEEGEKEHSRQKEQLACDVRVDQLDPSLIQGPQ